MDKCKCYLCYKKGTEREVERTMPVKYIPGLDNISLCDRHTVEWINNGEKRFYKDHPELTLPARDPAEVAEEERISDERLEHLRFLVKFAASKDKP